MVFLFRKNQLLIVPETRNEGTYELSYVPDAPPIEKLEIPKGFAKVLVYEALIDAVGSEYGDVADWRHQRNRWEAKVMEWSHNRNTSEANRVRMDDSEKLNIDEQDLYIL